MTIRAVIVEDEPLAIDRLRGCLAYAEQVEVVGEARDGRAAVALLDALAPDLLFLDVQLPLLSGFEVLRQIARKPAVIFTTAHNEYAVHAFEWGAFDYLVKPFERERVLRALERYVQRSNVAEIDGFLDERLRLAAVGEAGLRRFFVKHRGVTVPIEVDEIVSIQAADDYSAVHVKGVVHLVHLPLREFARKLDAAMFRRVHRCAMVNVRHIRRVEPAGRGAVVQMSDGSAIQASRSGVQALRTLQL